MCSVVTREPSLVPRTKITYLELRFLSIVSRIHIHQRVRFALMLGNMKLTHSHQRSCSLPPFGHFTLTVGWEKTFCNWIDNIFQSESPVWICKEAACFPCCLAEQLHSHGSLVSAEDGLSFPARCELLSCSDNIFCRHTTHPSENFGKLTEPPPRWRLLMIIDADSIPALGSLVVQFTLLDTSPFFCNFWK